VSATESSMPTNGRWGWYKDHLGVERQRMSKLLDHVDTDRFYLERWKQGQVALGLAARDDLVVAVKTLGRPGRDGFTKTQKETLYGITKKASEAAVDMDGAELGNAVHRLTERLDRGEPIATVIEGIPPPWNMSLLAYEALIRLNSWQTIEIERTVDIDELDVRGSFDRIRLIPGLAALLGPGVCQYRCAGVHAYSDRSPDELPVIDDVKTEEKPWKNGIHIAPQLAGYSRAKKMWLPDDGSGKPAYVSMPCVRQDVGVVTHVRDGDAVPYFVNLHEGWEAVVAAAQQRDRLKRAKRDLGVVSSWFAPLPAVKRPAPAELAVTASVIRQAGETDRQIGAVLATLPPAPLDEPPAVTDTTLLPPVQDPRNPLHYLVAPSAPAITDTTLPPAPDRYITGSDEAPLDGMRRIIADIWLADSREDLAALYADVTGREGLPWVGSVKMAGEARLRIVECPQRTLHTALSGGKCACGWTVAVRP
jgi:hypothetical protein